MNEPPLGRLERVDDLRKAWATEDQDFTPWLARPENLAVLAETLGLELETEAQEEWVGPFRADIVCKEIRSDAWVLIENQLEETDHKHLGQLLTYAAGLDAVTTIWIARSFRDEHRAALDRLNEITEERFRFFGLEIELWRIGESLSAPKFNIVSKPNDCSRSVTRAAAGSRLSKEGIIRRQYWTAFQEVLKDKGGPVSGTYCKPRADLWMICMILRSGFRLATVMESSSNCIGVELYVYHRKNEIYFDLLKRDKDEIEREFGRPLEWREPTKTICLENADPKDETDWPRQHKWLADRLNAMHRVFAPRVNQLHLDDRPSDG